MKTNNSSSRTVGVLTIIALTLAMAQPLRASITVTNLADSGPGSLRQAITDAAPGDTIDFAVTGAITLTSGELVIDKDVTISGPGATNLTVSGNNLSRIFKIPNSSSVMVSGLALADGHAVGPNTGAGEGYGGCVFNYGRLTITNCTLRGNLADEYGGVIYHTSYSGGALTIINSLLHSNSSPVGGAICNSGNAAIIGSCFSSNSASAGGAIWGVFGGSVTMLTNCTLSRNVATGYAGGIGNAVDSTISIDSSTICSNLAGAYGGGISLGGDYDDVFTIRNSIVAGNNAPTGPDVSGAQGLVSQDHNLIQNTNGSAIIGVTTHNIYGQDPLLGPLANNGGPTMTHALLPSSPAIDQGRSGGLTTDQRGQPRPVNFPDLANAGGGDGGDIGAYELQDRPQTGPGFTVNSTNDINDGIPGVLHCSLREAIAAAAPDSTINLAVAGTITLTNGQLVINKNLSISGPGATNLTLSGNHSSRIFNVPYSWSVILSGLTLADGYAKAGDGYGGGIVTHGNLTITNCTLSGNLADESGGAIYHTSYSGGTLTIINSVLRNNAAPSGVGGAICNDGDTAVIGSCIYSNNASSGGAIWGVFAGSATSLTNTTISGNYAVGTGGGLGFAIDSTMSADSCTISSNLAGAYGGGISLGGEYDDVFTIRNSIVAGNSAPTGPDLSGPRELISQDYNLIQNTSGGTVIGVTTHNIYGQDPLLGPLKDNGGPTLTHALLPGSPALDAGQSGGLTTDQRGKLRLVDLPGVTNASGGDGSDIGAFELEDLPQTGPIFTINTTQDANDGIAGILHCSLREAIAHAAPGDTIDFAVTGTITLTNGQLTIAKDLTISGPGATNLTVSGNNASRVFALLDATVVSISGLAVSQGRAWGGGAIQIDSTSSLTMSNCSVTASHDIAADYSGGGGGIKNMGRFTGIDCAVLGNSGAGGGGIWNAGKLDLINSAVCSNFGGSAGGGIWHAGSPSSMVNCTISGNSVMWNGGGVMVTGYATMTCSNCTITANNGWYMGGGIFLPTGGDTAILRNTILAGNAAVSGPDCLTFGLTSLDYNFIGNTNGIGAIIGTTTHNIYGQNPKLGPLADNGGPTPTHALLPGSPAIDHGSGGLATDQRGLPRSFNFPLYYDSADASDIGAYELQERAQTNWVVNGSSSNLVFTVNSTNDVDDGVAGIAHCSLREAIAAANANADSNSITFATSVPGLMNGVTGTIALTNGQIVIGQFGGYDLSITGPGATNLTISGNNATRVFSKSYSTAAISGLTIADGFSGGYDGSGIYNLGGTLTLSDCVVSNCNSSGGWGGGVWSRFAGANPASLGLVRCAITKNSAGFGGGVFNLGWFYASDCTFSSNLAFSDGGGIYNGTSARLENCTISGNQVSLNSAAWGGGGIVNNSWYANGADIYLLNCTVSSNFVSSSHHAGGVLIASGAVKVRNTIIAGNAAGAEPDCAGNLISEDYNLIQNTNGCVITGTNAHDIYNQDPKLGPLADLGGPTPTHALRFDSPALDAGHSGGLTTDQRGLPRPIDDPNTPNAADGDGSDIGAYEADPTLRMTGISKVGPDIRMSFSSLFGRTYDLEWTDNLPDGWQALTNNVPGTGGPLQSLDVGGATQPKRFYRAVQLP
jgi:CSLREA domain-containing protein